MSAIPCGFLRRGWIVLTRPSWSSTSSLPWCKRDGIFFVADISHYMLEYSRSRSSLILACPSPCYFRNSQPTTCICHCPIHGVSAPWVFLFRTLSFSWTIRPAFSDSVPLRSHLFFKIVLLFYIQHSVLVPTPICGFRASPHETPQYLVSPWRFVYSAFQRVLSVIGDRCLPKHRLRSDGNW